MRRHKNLFEKIISFQNLLSASMRAQKGKRFKKATLKFNFQLENELWTLHRELINDTYQPGQYRNFTIYEPKKRLISAAPYRDRVVHHAIHNILEPVFEPTFIHDSYATRKGKGTHAAINRFQNFSYKNKYVLKCDIRQYFPSIRREILLALIERKVSCSKTMNLIQKIVNAPMANNLHSQPASSRNPYR
ncbi:MAG: Retron-type reverse transcriptase [Deltaproteobacteria bacterium]|nr:MAG: Retron-type reverse transcriptase [Deltaproteobacteria bacterium]